MLVIQSNPTENFFFGLLRFFSSWLWFWVHRKKKQQLHLHPRHEITLWFKFIIFLLLLFFVWTAKTKKKLRFFALNSTVKKSLGIFSEHSFNFITLLYANGNIFNYIIYLMFYLFLSLTPSLTSTRDENNFENSDRFVAIEKREWGTKTLFLLCELENVALGPGKAQQNVVWKAITSGETFNATMSMDLWMKTECFVSLTGKCSGEAVNLMLPSNDVSVMRRALTQHFSRFV